MTGNATYVAVGDSNTGGTPETPVGTRWPDLLARYVVGADRPGAYRNLAAYGALSADVASEQLPHAIGVRPRLLSIVCGANDILLAASPDVVAYRQTLDRIFDEVRRRCEDTVIVTATLPDLGRFVGYRSRARARVSRGVERFNAATEAVASAHGATCVDLASAGGLVGRASFADDGYHPSCDGHRRMAALFLQALGPLMPLPVTASEPVPRVGVTAGAVENHGQRMMIHDVR